ncbi:MAG: aminotransferase class III-fold pyridoxal phosphate-dependent enzyme [Acidobacteria bacterium]|nr:aminotransferase class III-fold pyridoxal phosphate-dependent enzyme [Acidobacteriota bacterium]
MLKEIKVLEDAYQLPTYAKIPLSIERGSDCHVYDVEGNAYLDLYGGHAVISTGHCHPRVVQAIREQAERLIFYSNAVYNGARAQALQLLLKMAAPPFVQAFFANSGSEANENAIKLARALTRRREIISLIHSFHGRTYGSLSSTGIAKYSSYLNTPVPAHRVLPASEAAAAISTDTAAVMIEPIQSLGGMREIPLDTLREISSAARRSSALLIFDEVQTGISRTGTFLYSQQPDIRSSGVQPDITTLAKGIASGLPASALLVTGEVARQVKSGDLGATFGGGPLACAAIRATLQVIEEEKLGENAAATGRYLREKLRSVPMVREVLGRGLLIGMRLDRKAKEVQEHLLSRRIIVGTSDDAEVLRLMPPLTLRREAADLLIDAMSHL